jgi:hypothetical protein
MHNEAPLCFCGAFQVFVSLGMGTHIASVKRDMKHMIAAKRN